MVRDFKYCVGCNNEIDLNFGLTPTQVISISNLLDALIQKYVQFNKSTPFRNDRYFDGVSDGLNHAFKLITGYNDDYLTGIKDISWQE